jgi:transcription antitermination factor NusG
MDMTSEPNKPTGLCWYAVHTRSQMEERAFVELKRLGLEVFFPFTRVRRRRRKPGTTTMIVEWIEKPFFSRYVFVGLDHDGQIGIVNAEDTVSTIVTLGGIPVRIPEIIIDRLMALTDDRGLVGAVDLTARPLFAAGTELRLKAEHPMAGVVGEVVRDAGKEVVMLLHMLGATREIKVDPRHVKEAVPAA